MFSSNNQISGRQLNRLIVVDFLGIIGLVMPQLALHLSLQDGLIAIFYAIIISLAYTFIILLIKQKIKKNLIDYLREKAGRFIATVVGLFFAIKYFIFAVIVLCILGTIVNTVLLPEVNPMVIIGAMIIVSCYSVIKGIESRGRMAEILYYVVLIPIVIILLFSFRHVDKYNITPFFLQSQIDIIKSALIIALLFSPSEMLLFNDDHFDFNKKSKRSVYYGVITVGLVNLLLFAVNVGIFGVNGMLKEEWPTITLMQVVEISGMFFERQDGIMSIFYIVSLFATISALINYVVLLVKKMFRVESNRRYGWITVLLLFIATSTFVNGNYIWKMNSEEAARAEIEDRAYVMALGIDRSEGKLSVTYAFPNIASSSGEEGKGGDTGNSDNSNQLYSCSVEDMYEAENVYSRQSDKKLDFSHLKAIVIGVPLLEDKEGLEQVIRYFKDESEFARSTNVCVSLEEANEIISLNSQISVSIGEYLNKMLTNNITGSTCNIGNLISNQADTDLVNTLPVLDIWQDLPNFTESVIMQGLDIVKYCNLEENTYLSFTKGIAEGSVLDLNSNGSYMVKNNDADTNVKIIADKTVHLTLNITGSLEARDSIAQNANEDDVNEAIEEAIIYNITDLRKNYKVDYLETHKLLGIYDKKLWEKYQDDKKEELYDALYIEVKCEFTIG